MNELLKELMAVVSPKNHIEMEARKAGCRAGSMLQGSTCSGTYGLAFILYCARFVELVAETMGIDRTSAVVIGDRILFRVPQGAAIYVLDGEQALTADTELEGFDRIQEIFQDSVVRERMSADGLRDQISEAIEQCQERMRILELLNRAEKSDAVE